MNNEKELIFEIHTYSRTGNIIKFIIITSRAVIYIPYILLLYIYRFYRINLRYRRKTFEEDYF